MALALDSCSVSDALGEHDLLQPLLGRLEHGLLVLGEHELVEHHVEHRLLGLWLGREVALE